MGALEGPLDAVVGPSRGDVYGRFATGGTHAKNPSVGMIAHVGKLLLGWKLREGEQLRHYEARFEQRQHRDQAFLLGRRDRQFDEAAHRPAHLPAACHHGEELSRAVGQLDRIYRRARSDLEHAVLTNQLAQAGFEPATPACKAL